MSNLKQHLQKNQAEFLTLLYFFVQPWGNTFLVPLIIMSLLGGSLLLKWKHLNTEDQTVVKKIILLAASIWLPILISLPDSIAFNRTLSTTLTYPLYVFAGLYLAVSFSRKFNLELFLKILIPVILLWGLATLTQLFFNPTEARTQGLFYNNLMLGVVLAPLLPFVAFTQVHLNQKTSLMIIFTTLIIFISGTRSAWLISIIFLMMYFFLDTKKDTLKTKFVGLSFIALVISFITLTTGFNERITQTLLPLSEGESALNEASGGRLKLWEDAFNLGLKHPVNGIGASNFRYGQSEVLENKDRLWSREIPENGFTIVGFAHTHQIILEAWSNTGTPGLIGLIIFYILIFKQVRSKWHEKDFLALAGLFGLLALIFPLGSHNNFYGSWMIGSLWLWAGISQGLVFNRQVKVGNPL